VIAVFACISIPIPDDGDEAGPSVRVYFISQDEPIGLWEMVDRILAAGQKHSWVHHRACRRRGRY
jgi:hypothetical protein